MYAMLEGTPLVDGVIADLRRTQSILDDLNESLKVSHTHTPLGLGLCWLSRGQRGGGGLFVRLSTKASRSVTHTPLAGPAPGMCFQTFTVPAGNPTVYTLSSGSGPVLA